MNNKKRVLGLAILGVMILSISFVSAGFWDDLFSFGDDTPVIVTVYDVIDNEAGGTNNEINPVLEDVNSMEIRFLAQDPNGEGDLPDTGGIDLASSVGDVDPNAETSGANIEVYVTAPNFGFDVLATSCTEDISCTSTGGCTANQREYSCTVPMQYYYESGTWDIKVAIADLGNGIGSDDTKTFEYTLLPGYMIVDPITGLQWVGISLSGTDQEADNDPLQLKNIGNKDYNAGSITGQDLSPDGGQTGDSLPVDAFSVSTQSGGAECDAGVTADALSHNTQKSIVTGGTLSLIYGEKN